MRFGEVRLERYGALEQFGGVRPAELMGDDAEAVEAAGVIRIGGTDLPVKALGLGEPPGLVMIERCGELPGDRLALVRCHGSWPPTDIAVVLAFVLAVIPAAVLADIDKVKSRVASRIAPTGCRTNITANATGGGRP